MQPNRVAHPNRRFKGLNLFVLFLAIVFLYHLLFINRSSFVVDGERYFALFDDAMISMRYAKNLASGDGLVWNPGGEKVEGFTNPLWVFFMALVHLAPIAESKTGLVVQLVGSLLSLGTLAMLREIARLLEMPPSLRRIALTAVAFYYPLVYWALVGMEVSLLTFILTLCVYLSLQNFRRRNVWTVFLLIGVSTLVRIDAAVFVFPFVAYFAPQRDRISVKEIATMAAIPLVFLASQSICRFLYYGEWLPNTYYLKMADVPALIRLLRGSAVFIDFIYNFNVMLALCPFLIFGKEDYRRYALPLALFGTGCAYSVYVGGDAWESWGGSNRYLSVAMPFWLIVVVYSLDRMLRRIFNLELPFTRQFRGRNGVFLQVTFAGFLVLTLNGFSGSDSLLEASLLKAPYLTHHNEQHLRMALAIGRQTTQDAKVAVTWAGVLPYFVNRHCVDLLGKNDKEIARLEPAEELPLRKFLSFQPGHTKWDYSLSLCKHNPDIVAQTRSDFDPKTIDCAEYVKARIGEWEMYVRKNSEKVTLENNP